MVSSRMARSENARNPSKKHDEVKLLRFVQNGGLLELRQYLKKRKGKLNINYQINKQKRYVRKTSVRSQGRPATLCLM